MIQPGENQPSSQAAQDQILGAASDVPVSDCLTEPAMGLAAERPSWSRRSLEWTRRHKTGLLLGAAGVSAAVTFGLHPGRAVDEIESQAPWAVPGILATDVVNAAGIGMMATSLGRNVDWRHIWRIKSQLLDIAEHANGSKVFNAGFWTSTTGGVGAFAVGAAAVLPNFPPESWAILTPLVADLGTTITSRVAVRQVIVASAAKNQARRTE